MIYLKSYFGYRSIEVMLSIKKELGNCQSLSVLFLVS